MLQTTTLPKHALGLLKLLSPALAQEKFYLAGGTALALRLGHRISIDLDFFSPDSFDPDQLLIKLESLSQSPIHIFQKTSGSLCLEIQKAKVEFFHYPYPQLEPTETMEGVTLASLADNGTMKLSALVNRGTKKDFWDMAALLEIYPLSKWISLYQEKFPNSDTFMLTKSLIWFDDAENDPDPKTLNKQTWSHVKSMISKAVVEFD